MFPQKALVSSFNPFMPEVAIFEFFARYSYMLPRKIQETRIRREKVLLYSIVEL
jgi:hypothetical protein